VVDDDGMRTPLGLRALARVVDHERVEERQVGDGGVGIARGRQGQGLARQPFEGAVLAEVHDGVGPPTALGPGGCQPPVEGQVVVRGRDVGGMVSGDRIGAEPSRRLDGDQHVAKVQAREVHRVAVDVHLAGRRPPQPLHLAPGLRRQAGEPVAIGRRVKAADGPFQFHHAQLGVLVGEPCGQLVHQGVPAGRDPVDSIAGAGHGTEQLDGRRRRVEADGVAQPGPLGRVGREHDGDPPDGDRDPAKLGGAHRQRGEPGGALGIGPGGHDVRAGLPRGVDHFLVGEGRSDDPAVELGDGHPCGHLQRRQARVVRQPQRT
jgi:hypothetical protein